MSFTVRLGVDPQQQMNSKRPKLRGVQAGLQEYLDSLYRDRRLTVMVCIATSITYSNYLTSLFSNLDLHTSGPVRELSLEAGRRLVQRSDTCDLMLLITDCPDNCQLAGFAFGMRGALAIVQVKRPSLNDSLNSGEAHASWGPPGMPPITVVLRPAIPCVLFKAAHEALMRVALQKVISQVARDEQDRMRSESGPESSDLATECPLYIMVVEDNAINQRLLVKALNRYGYRDIITASDGQQGVDKVKSNPSVNLIFMDMQMPVMDGCQAARLIRQLDLSGQPHITALTANAFSEDRDACLSAGMCQFLVKPIEWERLECDLRNTYKIQVTHELPCPGCHAPAAGLDTGG